MYNKGLTITLVAEAESANYGEGFGNISVLKKMSRADGNTYTYISRQALRYSLVNILGWTDTPLHKDGASDKSVVQFAPDASIADYPEIDMFGYMKTKKDVGAATRPAVARLSNAISLEPYRADTDYLTNMGLAKRAGANNSIAQREIHHSLYAYTVTVDLDRVGVDGDESIAPEKRAERVNALIDGLFNLYRDICARRENLSPVFAVGGVFDRKNPYFENRVEVRGNKLNADRLRDVIAMSDDARRNTVCGMLSGTFANEEEICKKLPVSSMSELLEKLKKSVEEVYNG